MHSSGFFSLSPMVNFPSSISLVTSSLVLESVIITCSFLAPSGFPIVKIINSRSFFCFILWIFCASSLFNLIPLSHILTLLLLVLLWLPVLFVIVVVIVVVVVVVVVVAVVVVVFFIVAVVVVSWESIPGRGWEKSSYSIPFFAGVNILAKIPYFFPQPSPYFHLFRILS